MKSVVIAVVCLFGLVYAETRPQSACELDRETRINSTLEVTENPILHLIPECESNGDYAALQCFTKIDWCVCYRRNGENINTPSKNIKSCDCVRAKDDARTSGADYIPQCERSGYYAKKQCSKGSCWCVDRNGKAVTDPSDGDVTC